MLIEEESCLSRSKVRSDLPKVLSASQKGKKDKPMENTIDLTDHVHNRYIHPQSTA